MNRQFEPSELVTATDGTPYHIRIRPEALADNVILVGDPARVDLIAGKLDKVGDKTSNREIVSCKGEYKGKPITVLSTGMGVGCIDIVVNELDICANVDLEKREPKPVHRSLNLIRIGTCGSLQDDLEVGTHVASAYAIGIDGLAYYYKGLEKINDEKLIEQFLKQTSWDKKLPYPYAVKADNKLLNRIASDTHKGITITAPGFYAPQGRQIGLQTLDSKINSRLKELSYNGLKAMNYEMETSALYALGTLLGHKTLTVCNVIAGRTSGKFAKDYHRSMEELIENVLERL